MKDERVLALASNFHAGVIKLVPQTTEIVLASWTELQRLVDELAELRARAEEQRASRAEEQADSVSDASRSLRRAQLEKLRLSNNLEAGTITPEVFATETARIESEIAALKNIQRLPSSG